jgi:hypothetical protein
MDATIDLQATSRPTNVPFIVDRMAGKNINIASWTSFPHLRFAYFDGQFNGNSTGRLTGKVLAKMAALSGHFVPESRASRSKIACPIWQRDGPMAADGTDSIHFISNFFLSAAEEEFH